MTEVSLYSWAGFEGIVRRSFMGTFPFSLFLFASAGPLASVGRCRPSWVTKGRMPWRTRPPRRRSSRSHPRTPHWPVVWGPHHNRYGLKVRNGPKAEVRCLHTVIRNNIITTHAHRTLFRVDSPRGTNLPREKGILRKPVNLTIRYQILPPGCMNWSRVDPSSRV